MAERLSALSTAAFASHLLGATPAASIATHHPAPISIASALPGSVEELAIVNNFLIRLGEEIAVSAAAAAAAAAQQQQQSFHAAQQAAPPPPTNPSS
jgi:hypothetical protein